MTSFRYKLMQFGLRATFYRNKMIKDAPKGNARHSTPKGKYKARFIRSEFDGRAVWTIHPQSGPTEQVYVHQHGGGFIYGLLPLHWMSFSELCDLAQMTIILPDYPLAPSHVAAEIHDWTDRHFMSLTQTHGIQNIWLGGDSAGGNLALVLAQKAKARGAPISNPLMLWSPWVDLTEPETPFTKEDDYEALITPFGLEPIVGVYAGDLSRDDPLISPALADMATLPEMHIITGEQDILYPAAKDFAARAKTAGKLKSLISEPDYGHYWMFYPVPDRHKTLREIAGLLG